MQKILALWSCPRSRSTVFERMMLERGDFVTHHEPFGPYFYEQTRDQRDVEVDPNREVSFDKILHNLRAQVQTQRVFIKEFPLHIISRVTDDFLESFGHAFLVRHPEQVVASYLAGWPDVREAELGYSELVQMFDLVQAYQGRPPVVINADDLVTAPESTVRAFCGAMNIPFLPKSLTWKPERREEFVYIEGGRWHESLNQSTGFEHKHNSTYPTMESSSRLRELVAAVMPYYEKLNRHCLSNP